jgi:c-di-GMP-binding flagellar brake protein YcgR
MTLKIEVELFINGLTKKFTTSDISLLGMKLISEEKLPVGEEVLVLFEDLSAHKQFMLKAVVLRNIPNRKEPEKTAAVGLKFIFENETQKKELMKFIARKS